MRFSWLPLLGLLVATSTGQDVAQLGFERTESAYPGGTNFAASTALENGRLVVFDGVSVLLYDEASGVLLNEIGTFPSFVFPSFVIADPQNEYVYLAESSNHTIQRVRLAGLGGLQPVTTLVNAYDASFRDASNLYVSAATCGFGCGNEIWRIDTTTGSSTLVAEIPGASGPLVFGPSGDLYYGTATAQFPPPPEPSTVVRYSPAQLDGPAVLSEADAELVGAGFAGAGQMATDPRSGAIFLALNNFATGENRIHWVKGAAADSPVLLEGRPFLTIGNVDFLPGPDAARFLPHQPSTGGTLRYTTTDFGALLERHAVRPLRPALAFSGPGTIGPGAFSLTLASGPASGFARIFFCPSALVPPAEAVLVRAGIPLFIGLHGGTAQRYGAFLPLDAQGRLLLDLQNPGNLQGTSAVQLLLIDRQFHLAGMSSLAFL